MLTLLLSLLFIQDPPLTSPVSIEDWKPGEQTTASTQVPGLTGIRYEDEKSSKSYYSPTLKGLFEARYFFVDIQGKRYEFWGARILRLDPSSPVRGLGLVPGDVITRLDGTKISEGLSLSPVMNIPELEKHYGRTEFRFIARGTNQVRAGDVVLDHSESSPLTP